MLLWSTFCILTEMLPVERVAADWERLAWPGPLYSLAPLYKHAKACPALTVTRRSNLCKHKKSSTSLTTFILNWAHFFQPIDEIYQTAITPPSPLILAPVLGAPVWLVILADPGFSFLSWHLDQTCVNKKGAAHHWLPSFWIGRVSFHPLMRYIKPQSPRPPPWSWRLSLAPQFRVWFSRIQAFSTWQTRQIHSPRHWLGWGVTSGVRFGLAHYSNGL